MSYQESKQLKGRVPATQRGRRDDAEMEKEIRGLFWLGINFLEQGKAHVCHNHTVAYRL